ncbi:TPA: bifunctional adenosylcobinamide kinase/adenosylcobinamide-phosphate guanylyltransferase [Serratia fonticola]|jgi:adenosylcobinamide kinase/adenosylcobinamide-phosphate guanylyltransferase|uniref:Bifunctional adenosylcobalamin biosynthesis protein n=1 Tax=Serratia fonticola TaxID=47917 RepID=A0A0F7D2N0_SERFO|nr:bifunctional adenosylcobinamide kinase/adenosylcobinamide-phosphate guanylyltransferase [Serratia fonticola]AKG71020.1 adenosylcobinamide kinase [Serratia fonticola]CAI1530138.1 Adenosylcobinamide kinase [Serratia fonticola]CAI1672603.1 Adenosylcobinamide kinase [Serratia fonticola]CAI1683666.1 Adenosylcobinamide kinase [Serratia fonticola]CAI1808971.1 Adenosylcobinamide kinase [Serratia fonticola]
MILITGGARSGKSSLAERLASGVSDRVLYIATSVVTDEEMAERVKLHRQARPAHWRTWEGSQQLASVIDQQAGVGDAVILECITTLIANLMFDLTGEMPVESIDFAVVETAIQRQIDDLLAACARSPAAIYLVTNELGMGIVPENRLARHFRDIAGRVNQRLAAAAESVLLVISGIEVKIK